MNSVFFEKIYNFIPLKKFWYNFYVLWRAMQKMSFMMTKIHTTVLLFISFIFLSEGKSQHKMLLMQKEKKQVAWIITGDISKQKGYADAAKVEEGEYKRSRKVGVWIKYWPNGEKKAEIFYDQWKTYGDYKSFYENGQLEESGSMKAGNLVGEFAMYYPDGTTKTEENF